MQVDFFDPVVDAEEVRRTEKVSILEKPKQNNYDVLVLAVAHKKFLDLGVKKIKMLGKKKSIFFDVKSIFNKKDSDLRL